MLFDSSDIAPWEAVIAQYPEALQHHSANKKDDSLLALDEWYQTTLPSLLSTRNPKHINAKELQQLMSWKLKVKRQERGSLTTHSREPFYVTI